MNNNNKERTSNTLLPLLRGEISFFKEKYAEIDESNLNEAHALLQSMFLRYERVNLLMEKQPLLEIELGKKMDVWLKKSSESTSITIDALKETAKLSSLYVQLINYSKGSTEYKLTTKKIEESEKRSKNFDKKYIQNKRQSESTFKELLRFTKKRNQYNIFSFGYKLIRFSITAGLLSLAILVTIGLDRLGIFIDKRLKDNYLFHVVILILFALIERFLVSPVEEKYKTQLSKKIFFNGLKFLEDENESFWQRFSENVKIQEAHVDSMLFYLNAVSRSGQEDVMKLPVKNFETLLRFFENKLQFILMPDSDIPNKYAVLYRPNIKIGLTSNENNYNEEGCIIQVNSIEQAFKDLEEKGFENELTNITLIKYKETDFKCFNLNVSEDFKIQFCEILPKKVK